jgi:hypothetical protein
MADIQRTKNQLLVLFADNITAQISPQDLRDFLVTVMEDEFQFPGDFFKGPEPKYVTTDKTTRGWFEYSQEMHSNYGTSFGKPLAYNQVSGNWIPADVSRSAANPCRGIAADNYVSGATDVKVLRKGIVYDSGLSNFSGYIGKPVYLDAAASVDVGDISVAAPGDSLYGILGYIEGSTTTTNSVYKWRFDGTGNWPVAGI